MAVWVVPEVPWVVEVVLIVVVEDHPWEAVVPEVLIWVKIIMMEWEEAPT